MRGFCPGVPGHKGITIVLSLLRSHWLAVVYCLVFCIGSREPVHEDRTHASHASHGCESTWRAMRVNMRVTHLLKANCFMVFISAI